MGWTDGISSSYYWLMLLPVMSAATSLGLAGLVAATAAGWRRVPLVALFPSDQDIYRPINGR